MMMEKYIANEKRYEKSDVLYQRCGRSGVAGRGLGKECLDALPEATFGRLRLRCGGLCGRCCWRLRGGRRCGCGARGGVRCFVFGKARGRLHGDAGVRVLEEVGHDCGGVVAVVVLDVLDQPVHQHGVQVFQHVFAGVVALLEFGQARFKSIFLLPAS